MANNNQSDIVINAQAGTKQAEANVQELDAKIRAMTAQDTKLKQFGRDLLGVSNDAQAATKAMGTGFATLQGSFTGVITKLGAVGLAIGGLKKAWDLAQSEQQRYLDSIKSQAEASSKSFTVLKDSTKGILDSLEKLDKLADVGYLDDTAIEQTNSLVSQLNDLWGDVGLSVDQATGKVNGLQAATQKITNELKAMALEQLAIEEKVAQAEYDQASNDYSKWFKEDGSLQEEWSGMLIAGNWTGEGSGAFRTELDNKRKLAQANLLALQQRRKQLESSTTVEEINDSISKAEAAKQQDLANKQEAAKTKEQLTTTQTKLSEQPDWKLLNLQSELAIAQATGGDVAGAKAAVDAYTQERDRNRFNQLEGRLREGVKTYNERLTAYNQGVANNADDATLLALAEALNEVTVNLQKDAEEFNRLGAKLEQPETPVEEPTTEVSRIARAMTNGTFSSYGLNGLTYDTIEQQQLEVQKQIADNTKNLNVPIVGE